MNVELPDDFPLTVSVITPAYNAVAVVARAIRAVQAQTLEDWELIIVDDGSDDGTAALVETLAQEEPRLKLVRHALGQGAAAARNTALTHARGRYIAFLDADDAWRPDKLDVQLRAMQDVGAGLSYTDFMRISEAGARRVQVPPRVTQAQLRLGNCICCSSAIYDRSLLGSIPMPNLALRQDYALWLTLLDTLPYAVGVNQPLVDLHVTRGSLSSNKWRAMRATWAMHHGHFGSSALRSVFYVLVHTVRRVMRG